MALTGTARLVAALIAILALGSQLTTTILDVKEGMGLLEVLWRKARYFTSLMVVLTGIYFAVLTRRGSFQGPGFVAAVTSWIIVVGVVYQALLAADHNPTGIEAIANEIDHSVVPILTLIFWIAFAPKSGLTFSSPTLWILCPMGYAIYALLRGLMDGKFPYFFLNPETQGWVGVTLYILGLGAFFYVVGAILVVIAKRMAR